MEASSDEAKSHQTKLDNDIELLENLFEKVQKNHKVDKVSLLKKLMDG